MSWSGAVARKDEFTNLVYHVLTQYALKAGLQQHKWHVKKGVHAYIKQIHYKLPFAPIRKSLLTQQKRADFLWALMFLNENYCGTVKSCMCVDGRKQQKISNKSYATSPTVSTE